MNPWRICIDTGGTFTDCWAIAPDGNEPVLVKVLSSGRLRVRVVGEDTIEVPWELPDGFFVGWQVSVNSNQYSVIGSEKLSETTHRLLFTEYCSLITEIDLLTGEEAPVIGARLLTGTKLNGAFPSIQLRLATTRGTNALLEEKGAPTAFFVTQGFGDLLEIRDQRRPDLFALNHQKPRPLYDAVIEVPERLDESGNILESLRIEPDFRQQIQELKDRGIKVAAIALMHSYVNPDHERKLAEVLRKAGFSHVSLSSELAPLIKLLPRAETAVVDAYLTPVMGEFLDRVSGVTNDLLVMTSAGGLESREAFRPKDSLFSGPAGGVVGAAASGKACGFEKLITFDMGGTSTDVARFDGDFAYQFQQTVGAATLLSTSLRIETVAAGGGSICRWTEGGLRVGPESAGANPGPACYGRGGPLAITDVNLLLGRIDPDNFGIPLSEENLEAARIRLRELMAEMGNQSSETEVLEGLIQIAVEQMADSIRTISIREGADPRDYALLAFGGAGPLHACDIAEQLGMSTIVVPAEAGVLSAFGLHHAVVERFAERIPGIARSRATAGLHIRQSVGISSEFQSAAPAGHPIAEEIASGGPVGWLFIVLSACVAAPIVEETMFRGVLYRSLRESSGRKFVKWFSVGFSSIVGGLIFALVHPQGLIGVPVLTTLAIGFSLVREWRSSLIGPMVMHALNNSMVTCILLLLFT